MRYLITEVARIYIYYQVPYLVERCHKVGAYIDTDLNPDGVLVDDDVAELVLSEKIYRTIEA